MRTVLSAISNLNIPPNARRLRQLPEFIACVLSEYALSSQCSCDVPDSALSAIQRYFDSELPAAKLVAEFPELAERAMLAAFSFLNADICNAYSRTGDIPTLRELSAQLGRNEASTSRTLKQFLGRVRHAMAL